MSNRHLQTAAALFGNGVQGFHQTRIHYVKLADGDEVALHDNWPSSWQLGDRIVLFIHGLAGDHQSSYIGRMAQKFYQRGLRTVRIDLRGCGVTEYRCSKPYNAGQSGDVRAAIEYLGGLCPGSPVTVIGISMGGNITLKLLGELGPAGCAGLDSGVAICPPVNIQRTVDNRTWGNYVYEQYFLSLIYGRFLKLRKYLAHGNKVTLNRRPRTVREHDVHFTAPLCGFESAESYYRESSSCFLLKQITVPTLILAARDDPLVPPEPLEKGDLSDSIELIMTEKGGHLGFIGRAGSQADFRWADWRVMDWVSRHGKQSRGRLGQSDSFGANAL